MEENNQDELVRRLLEESGEQLDKMQQVIDENEAAKAEILANADRKREEKRSGKSATLIFALLLVVLCAGSYAGLKVVKPMLAYGEAGELLEEGRHEAAKAAYEALGDYKDSREMIKECVYRKAESLIAQGKTGQGLFQYCLIRDYKDSRDKINAYVGSGSELIALGDWHSVAVNSIGQVLAVGDNSFGQCDVGYWKDIVAVAAGETHTLGLTTEGKVVATGSNGYGQCNVEGWKDITYIYAAGNTSYGIDSTGRVYATGDNAYGQCTLSDTFTGAIALAGNGEYIAALTPEGKVALAGNTSKLHEAQLWSNITGISAAGYTLCGLTGEGTVLVDGDITSDAWRQWSDVKTVAAGNCYVVAVTSLGEVLSTSSVHDNLRDAIFIRCGVNHILALKPEGQVAAVGTNGKGECAVGDWRDIVLK